MRLRLISILLLCLPLAACGKAVHWKQEVLLQDGRMIIVERISEQTGKIYPENIVMEKSQKIVFVNPDTNEKIAWNIPQGLKPYALDFENSIPYLVLDAYTDANYNDWGCPNPPYLVYWYEKSVWSSIPFEQLPEKMKKRNLIDMSKEFQRFSKDDLLTLDEHQKWLKDLPKGRRAISREKINPIAEGCDGSTLYRLGRQSEIDTRR